MRGEFFRGVAQVDFSSMGFKGKLPCFYYDNTSMTSVHTASTRKVLAHLPHPGMRPVELYPGRCLVTFTAFEYRKTDIGSYNEFSIAVLISFRKLPIPGLTVATQLLTRTHSAFVWRLPVTTEIARIGGVELYGFPKFIADIGFRTEEGFLRCDLAEKGKHILTLRGKTLPTTAGKVTRIVAWSVKDGIPLFANVFTNPLEFAQSRSRSVARLTFGSEHLIGQELGGIDLDERPILYQYSPVNEAILFGGRNLMDV